LLHQKCLFAKAWPEPDNRSEMFFCERPARMRLEIFFKRNGLVFQSKSKSNFNLPRPELGSMRTSPGVVFFKTCLNIGGHPRVVLIGFRNATEYVNIMEFRIHGLPRRSSLFLSIKKKPGVAPTNRGYAVAFFVHCLSVNEEWRRGDSNPRPVTFRAGHLHVYSLIFISLATAPSDRLYRSLFRNKFHLCVTNTRKD